MLLLPGWHIGVPVKRVLLASVRLATEAKYSTLRQITA